MRDLLAILGFYFKDRKYFLLHVIEYEVKRYTQHMQKLGIANTEEIEDLLYHIRAYKQIESSIRHTIFEHVDITNLVEYKKEVEMQRAIERDFIFEGLKNISIGFFL